jgi:hypothetical protein
MRGPLAATEIRFRQRLRESMIRFAGAVGLTILGLALIAAAIANLYNIDPQPLSRLIGSAVVGALALAAAVALTKASKKGSSGPKTPRG